MAQDHYIKVAVFKDDMKALRAPENAWAKYERFNRELTAMASMPEQFDKACRMAAARAGV